MRKFLSTKAGTTFNSSSPNFTVAVRKDGIELIIKAERGCYGVLNLFYVGKGKAIIETNWGNCFSYLSNPDVQMPRIKKNCPKLYKLIFEGIDGIYQIQAGTGYDAIGKVVYAS